MAKLIRATDIKWAYSEEINTNPLHEFVEHLCRFVGQIIRSDEIGLIVWRGKPVLMIRVEKVNTETEENCFEVIKFKDSRLHEMLTAMKVVSKSPILAVSGFELFCYRPRPDKPYHPRIHPSYNRAREKASRVLDGIYLLAVAPDVKGCVSFAQVSGKISTKFFKELTIAASNEERKQELLENFSNAVDTWIAEFYTDDIGSKQYKMKNRYPLAPKPLSNCELYVITSDDNGDIIGYITEV